MNRYYKITIVETGRQDLKRDTPQIFNEIEDNFKTLDKLKEFLINRYGKMPKGKNKIYRDVKGKSVVYGFLHSFWNWDCSHNSKKWYQTDWISITEVIETPVLINSKGEFTQKCNVIELPK